MAQQDDDWKFTGIRVIPAGSLELDTMKMTAGMDRAVAIDFARVGAQKIWAGTVTIQANAKTGAHHHGALESVIYIIRGHARMRWHGHQSGPQGHQSRAQPMTAALGKAPPDCLFHNRIMNMPL